jgi:hypothetical protein
MGATTLAAIDPDPKDFGLVMTLKAASAILAGAVVAYADAGASKTVAHATQSLGTPVGVALTSQATVGGEVTVAMQGCVVTVICAATDTSIDAGHWVMVDSSVAGTVIEWDPAIGSHAATTDTGAWPIGIALKDSVAGAGTVGATVQIVVNICPIWTASA